MTYADFAKKIGTIPESMGPNDLNFLKSSKNEDVGLAGTIMIGGEWDPQTPAAERFLAIYSPMFSKFTRAGFLLVGLDLFKKVAQSFFLSFIGTPPERSEIPPIDRVYERASYDKMDALLQLVGLQLITAFMLQLLIRMRPYRDRLKNISEIMCVSVNSSV
jgi:hypothetical protein